MELYLFFKKVIFPVTIRSSWSCYYYNCIDFLLNNHDRRERWSSLLKPRRTIKCVGQGQGCPTFYKWSFSKLGSLHSSESAPFCRASALPWLWKGEPMRVGGPLGNSWFIIANQMLTRRGRLVVFAAYNLNSILYYNSCLWWP